MWAASAASFCLERPLARVLDAESGGDDKQLAGAVLALGLEQHPAQGRVNRQAGEVVSQGRELAGFIHRPQFLQQGIAALNGGGGGRIEEGEGLDLAQPECLHPQDDFGQVGALDFGLRVKRTPAEIGLRVEADANAVAHAPASSFALVCAALGNRLDGQALGAGAGIVAAHARQPRIDHVADAGNGERSLSDVRGNYNLGPGGGRKDPLLLTRAEPAE